MSWTVDGPVPTVDGVLTTPALLAAASGLALGLGLIVAIGAQNAFVLRQGLRLEHVAAVVAVCALSDLALITAGVLGAGAALTRMPWLLAVVCWAGAAFLLGYGLLAAPRARRPGALRPDAAGARTGLAGDRRQLHGADLAQSTRLPGHGAAARLDGRHPRPAPLAVRRRRRSGQRRLVHRPGLRRPPAPPPGPPPPACSARSSPARPPGRSSTASSPPSCQPSPSP